MDFGIYLYLLALKAEACPSCIDSMNNDQDRYFLLIVGSFILLSYIPLFILYKMAFKNRKKTDVDEKT